MNLSLKNIIFQLGLLTGSLALFDPLSAMQNDYFQKRSYDHARLLRRLPNEAMGEDGNQIYYLP